jgi:uncharacterized protein YraI
MRKVTGITAKLTCGLMLTIAGMAATAAPAPAAYGDAGYVYAGSEVRYGPSQFYGIVYITNYDANIPLGCWTDDGYGRRWFSLAYQSQRWVRADSVRTPQPVLPHC